MTHHLLALARAASPGPWEARTEIGHPGVVAVARPNAFDWICSMQVSNSPRWKEDAAFIAAASPDVVVALIGRVEDAEHELAKIRADFSRFANERAEGYIDKRIAAQAARIAALEAGLREACELLEGWTADSKDPPSSEIARFRALVTP